jgi:hypothetical protein
MRELYLKALVGVVAPAGGTTVSMIAQVESWLRVTSLVVGIAVGLATLISIIRKNKK